MRQLHERGAAGLAIDADGAALGVGCVLVARAAAGCRSLSPEAARALQRTLLPDQTNPDWLHRQCGRIADALVRGEVALAQIYGLYIPFPESAAAIRAALAKAGFDPDEPRVPAGNPDGGQWTAGGDAQGDAAPTALASATHDCAAIIQQCKEECITIFAERPGDLPGVGHDMAGRYRRCVRECCERQGCYGF